MKEGDTYVNARGEIVKVDTIFPGGVWLSVTKGDGSEESHSYPTKMAEKILIKCRKVEKATVTIWS